MKTNRIPEETVEKIRKSVDIVDVISEYVQLKKQGRNYFGLCPFHGESTPSFSVSPDKQIFHCFGCGAGGNVFSFLMDAEGFSFIEAIKKISDKTGVDLPQEADFTSDPKSKQHSLMIDAHELLKKLYHHILVNTKEGKKAKDYLHERGFNDDIIKTFDIGFAPDSWDMVTTFLSKRGFPLKEVEEAGLIAQRNYDGKYFDRFRSRVMFPIFSHQGKVIGYGGRILGEGDPKYLNSPETKIFNKGKTLYNLNLARTHIRQQQQVVLFEGYADVISAWGAGVQNGIATLGTSITEEQATSIRRIVESVVICYDADKAGVNAASRAAKMLTDVGCTVRIAQMPDGFDPDDYIKKFGPDRFKTDVIGASLTEMAFKLQYLRKGKNMQDEGERIRYIEEVLTEISKLPKAVERDHYLRQIAAEFTISLEALKQQQYQIFKQLKRNKDNAVIQRDNNARNKTLAQKKLLPAFHNAEKKLLAFMLKNEDIALRIQEEIGVSFNIDEHNAIAAYLYAYYEEQNEPDVSLFIQRIKDSSLQRIVTDLAMTSIHEELSDQELTDYVSQIVNHSKLLQLKEKEQEANDALRQQNPVKAAKILDEINKMKRKLKGSY